MFRGSLTVITVSGVPVRVHWTFLALLAWVFGAGAFRSGSLAEGLSSLLFIVAVFACVVAHEFGHILAARSFGIRTRDVTLLPIGGVAALERLPDKPWQELVVALAGPLVNVVIAAALVPGLVLRAGPDPARALMEPQAMGLGFVAQLALINLWLVLFNLIPAFPMDGGRVLRAVLAMLTDRARATRVAAAIGRAIAVAMAVIGLLAGLPMLLVLALFVFLGAGSEASAAAAKEMLRGLRVADVMVSEFRTLGAHEPLSSAVHELLANAQSDFPVTELGAPDGPIVGVLTRAGLVDGLARLGPAAQVGAVMLAPPPAAAPGDPALAAFETLTSTRLPLLPVIAGGRIVGLVTPENISEVVMVHGALARHASGSIGPGPGPAGGPRVAPAR